MPRIIAVAGGIGSGKSVVSRMLRVMGRPVYDCDSRAKELMDRSDEIKRRIAGEISAAAINPDGSINRKVLADEVFADKAKLQTLNAIVHEAVRNDIRRWADSLDEPACWVESAIIYESGIDRMVDEVWEVYAPEELRIARVMSRNSCSREQVEARIASQSRPAGAGRHPSVHTIVNDGVTALLPQVLSLLDDERKSR